jgi:hypothetical protein
MILIGWSGYAFAVSIATGSSENKTTRVRIMPCRINRNIQIPPLIFMAISYA